MEGLERTHAGVDRGWLSVHIGSPALSQVRRSRVECVVSFVVERHCFEAVLGLLDMRARSDFIIPEETRTSGLALRD